MSEVLRIKRKLTRPQSEFLRAREPNVLLSAGYGSGKSWALRQAMIQGSLADAGQDQMVVADTFARLSRDVVPALMADLDECGLGWEWRKAAVPGLPPRTLIVAPGIADTPMHMGSADNPDSLKGPNLARIYVEEAPLLPRYITGKQETLFSVLRSRLRRIGTACQMKMSGTPEGTANWTTDPGMFEKPPDDVRLIDQWQRDFRVVRGSTWDNAANLAPGYVESMMATMDPQQVEEKVNGKPAAGRGGQCYYAFDRDKNVRPVKYDRLRGPVLIKRDFNVEYMAAVLAQWWKGHLWIFDEVMLRDSNTPAMNAALARKLAALGVRPEQTETYPDASGRARKTVGTSDFEAMRADGFSTLRYRREGNPPVRDRVAAMNGALHHGRIVIDPSCRYLIRDLTSVPRDDDGAPKKSGIAADLTHMSDALGYAVVWLMPVRGRSSVGLV